MFSFDLYYDARKHKIKTYFVCVCVCISVCVAVFVFVSVSVCLCVFHSQEVNENIPFHAIKTHEGVELPSFVTLD